MTKKKTDLLIGNILVYTLLCNLLFTSMTVGKRLQLTQSYKISATDSIKNQISSRETMVDYDLALPVAPRDHQALRKILSDRRHPDVKKQRQSADLVRMLGKYQKQK